MPRSRITRTAFGWSGLGWLPALAARTAPPDRRSQSASAICERALLPVHRNSARAVVARAARRGGGDVAGARAGWSAPPASASSAPHRSRSSR